MRNLFTAILCAIIIGFILIGANTPAQPDFSVVLGGKMVNVKGSTISFDGETTTFESQEVMFHALENLSEDLFMEGVDNAIEHVLDNDLVILRFKDGEIRAIVQGNYDYEESFRTLNVVECDDYGTCLHYYKKD